MNLLRLLLKCIRVAMTCIMQEDMERERASASTGGMRAGADESQFGVISATLGWETFRLVHSTWLTAIELPSRDENKWDMQVSLSPLVSVALLH